MDMEVLKTLLIKKELACIRGETNPTQDFLTDIDYLVNFNKLIYYLKYYLHLNIYLRKLDFTNACLFIACV